ncbi:contractile injection system tape measure protein [Nitrosomonas sp. sh817]|uniref:contractile injection system tape measure protein n=1 Tax=Nitrosomonas sp. sh817 TaxID=3070658 RepID=UPI0027DCDCD4|nr:contractile injection system tape measure protein [Nitrosomonas sp. sh817]WMJ07957.1 contractile injection system tape measure protein [Nitrosomonas sp. sh817]
MRAGFSDKPAAHCIEALIFDCSFDSMAIAQTFEADMNVWLTTRLLPVIDSVLLEFDETGVVWRMDRLELDLGDIPEDNFYDVLMQRLREKLSECLQAQQNKTPDSAAAASALLPLQRISQLQSDLERLRDFLLTGALPWHINGANRLAHETMLQRLLQSGPAGGLLVTLLKRLSTDERTIAVKRLISQFPRQHLENLLSHMTPMHVGMLADFIKVYRQALVERGDLQYSPAEESAAAWTHVFEFLLSANRLPDHPQALLHQLIHQNAIRQPWQEPRQLVKQLAATAIQWEKSGKIDRVLSDALQKLYAGISGRKPGAGHHDIAVTRNQSARRAALDRKTPLARIMEALRGMGQIGEPILKWADQEPEVFRRQLQQWLSAAAVRDEVIKLPDRVLRDIHFVLSEQAALLLENLLSYSGKLYKLKQQGGELSRTEWQRKLWMASLAYWPAQPGAAFEPMGYLHALARGISDAASPREILRAWLAALQRAKSYGTLVMQLQLSIANVPGRQTAKGSSVTHRIDEPAEDETAWLLQQQLLTGAADAAQQPLRQHLQQLSIKHPQQLQHFYQDLRRGRYDLTAAHLRVEDLRSLIEGLLQTETATSDADHQLFLQSIDQRAVRITGITDQRAYYRKVLEAMLQNREIDVEAIATAVQRDADSGGTESKETPGDTQAAMAEAEAAKPRKADPPQTALTDSAPERQLEAVYAAAYRKLLSGLQQAGLLQETGRPSVTGMRVTELRQRLRELLSSMELDELAGKLPPALVLEIIYWLQPQAARIVESLLSHGAELHEVADLEVTRNQAQWRYRLQRAAIAGCLMQEDQAFEPATYLRALARAVSDGTAPEQVLLAWHEKLEQIKAYGALHAMLQTIDDLSQVTRNPVLPVPTAASSHADKMMPAAETQPAALSGELRSTRRAALDRKTPLARIMEALRGMGQIGEPILKWADQEPEVFRRQLQQWLSAAAVRDEVIKLPDRVLRDIHFVLSEQAALLLENLLSYSGKLYKLKQQGGELSRTEWQRKLWMASLAYWPAQPGAAFEPMGYLHALARGISDAASPREILRAWLAALQRAKSYGTLVMQLQLSIANVPGRQTAKGSSVTHRIDEPAEDETAWLLQQQLLTGAADAAQQPLRQHLQQLSIKHPQQLQHFYQDLRRGRYDLTAAHLRVEDLRSLIEGLLQTETATSDADHQLFLQSIDQRAVRITGITDQRAYYRKVLEAMLQNREIDVEAIATAVQRDADSGGTESKETPGDTQAAMAEAEAAKPRKADPPQTALTDSAPERQLEAVYAAAYRKLLSGLQQAGLLQETGRPSVTGMRVTELRQRLRELLSSMELDELAGKLPPALVLEIIYWLQPQAARIVESLLSHGAELHEVADLEVTRNQAQWRYRLQRAAIAGCLMQEDQAFEPATYLRALARAVSDGTAPEQVLLAWHEKLEQIKAYGALHAMLQHMISQSAATPGFHEESGGIQRQEVGGAAAELSAHQASPPVNWDSLMKTSRYGDIYEEIFIDNAGMVLAAPYLPRLFTLLELVDDGVFVDRQAAERAAHLLQFLVNGQSQSPEYQLTLNKILCGITTGIPICRGIEINNREQETIEGLLRGMIQNWKTVGNTSISGLRETFLQRKGVLQLKEDGLWYLTVEPGVFDMLLDSLPWSFSVIKHAWMERAVHVTWR